MEDKQRSKTIGNEIDLKLLRDIYGAANDPLFSKKVVMSLATDIQKEELISHIEQEKRTLSEINRQALRLVMDY